MITDWKVLCKQVSEELGIPEEDCIAEVKKYTKLLRRAMMDLEYVDYSFYELGKVFPRPAAMSDLRRTLDKGINVKDRDIYESFYKRWKQVHTIGRRNLLNYKK